MRALIAASMRDMMPAAAGLPGIADTDLDGFLRRLRREADPIYYLGLVLGTWVHQLTPLFTVGVPLPALLLPRTLRERHARRIVSTRLYLVRQAVFLVRLNAGMCWGQDPAVRAALHLEVYPADPGSFRA
ncbi:MAG: hypothetical protein OXT09_00710 [Myxococcales bacterium]|nr:hypothetical protein [Myxococcales bacterium]